jgi:hypothetical protein
LLTSARRRTWSAWLAQFDACPARLGKANGDCLLRRSGAMLSLANVMHFFAHKFACLRTRRFSLFGVSMGALDGFFLRHFNLPI